MSMDFRASLAEARKSESKRNVSNMYSRSEEE